MKRYILRKDLPTFKAGDIFEISQNGNLVKRGKCISDCIVAYAAQTLEKFPNILTQWFDEIPEEPKARTEWDLEPGDKYYTIFFGKCGDIVERVWEDGQTDTSLRSFGLCFLTVEEAQRAAMWLRAREALKRDAKGFKPDWENGKQEKWRVFYSHLFREFYYDSFCRLQSEQINFATLEDARASVEAHEKEWKIYLGVEE